jgi:hypothetical protein
MYVGRASPRVGEHFDVATDTEVSPGRSDDNDAKRVVGLEHMDGVAQVVAERGIDRIATLRA